MMRTMQDFEAAVRDKSLVLITDTARDDLVHRFPCPSVLPQHFEQKVIQNGMKNGEYYVLSSEEVAGIRRCPNC